MSASVKTSSTSVPTARHTWASTGASEDAPGVVGRASRSQERAIDPILRNDSPLLCFSSSSQAAGSQSRAIDLATLCSGTREGSTRAYPAISVERTNRQTIHYCKNIGVERRAYLRQHFLRFSTRRLKREHLLFSLPVSVATHSHTQTHTHEGEHMASERDYAP